MQTYYGSVASKGIAVGVIKEFSKKENIVKRERVKDVSAEKERFILAKKDAISQLEGLYELAIKKVGESNALIFDIHKMMIEDDDYTNSIINIIETQLINAEYAVAITGDNFAEIFSNMEDDYMKERATDIKDISERLLNALSNKCDSNLSFDSPCIIVADDLTPSETVQMDKNKILGFVTRKGSVNSHTAILARTMSVPAIVGVDIPDSVNGKDGIIYGENGSFILNPDEKTVKNTQQAMIIEKQKKDLLLEYKGKETITKSGKKIDLYANVGSVGDVGLALQNDAEGIGLFRSEFLYLEQKDYPSEDLQFSIYKQAAEMMAGKKVVIRTMDIGADKQIDYFNLEHEENPALGYRAIRICLNDEEMFKVQLRALVRASYFGKISIMIPMITSLWEVLKVKEILKEVELFLSERKIPFGEYELGIMIETPAAALMADELAKVVDFFSIGTNDLTQYTIAVDRQNQKLERFYDPHHPAILKMIKMVAEAGKENGIWTGICGELGADPELTATFIEYGIDEISVSPSAIFPIRKVICNLD
ncbi:MAG: phosphoenolpyruvate--protein phosphotransferase [Oscillospiraceae bacterium]